MYPLYAAVLDTLVRIEELSASLLNSLTWLMSVQVPNRVEPFGRSQKMPRTLAGGAILGGGECCGSKLQSVHAGEKVEELYKTNHLVSTVIITPYLANLVFISNDIIYASVVQPQLPLLLPFLILVCEGLF